LINTLKAGLKKEFTPSVKKAWEDVYKCVSDTMMDAHHTDSSLVSEELTPERITMV
jgi:hemoglobin-like flavoprotein